MERHGKCQKNQARCLTQSLQETNQGSHGRSDELRRRTKRTFQNLNAGALALLFLISACSGGATPSENGLDKSDTFSMLGTLILTDDRNVRFTDGTCYGGDGYSDIVDGVTVTMYDKSGGIIGAGAVDEGRTSRGGESCAFEFSVPNIPGGGDFYQYEIGHRGKLTISEAAARSGSTVATLGN